MSTREAASPGSTDSSSISESGTDRTRLLLAALIGIALFALYSATLSPSVAVGDSGELIAAAATLGISHPPGYPLWCLVHHAVIALLPGSPAFAANVGSAFFAALASVLVFGIATGPMRLPPLVAAGVALLHGVAPSLWSQAIVAEVYALNLVVLLLFLWRTMTGRVGALWGFLAGLALVSHGTNVVVVLPGLLWGAWRLPLRAWVPTGLALLLGLSPVLYLPVRSAAGPALDWGHPAEWSGFLDHVLRRQYGGAMWSGVGPAVNMVGRWAMDVTRSGTPLVWIPLIAGLVRMSRARLPLLIAGPLLAAALPSLLRGEQRVEVHVFWLPSLAFVWLLVGVGIAGLRTRWGILAGTLAVFLAVGLAVMRAPALSKRGNHIALDYARALLTPLPERAVLYVVSDFEAFGLMYLQLVEDVRPDVDVRVLGPTLKRNVYGRPVPRLKEEWAKGSRPFVVTLPKDPLDAAAFVPVGLAFRRRAPDVAPVWTPVTLRYRDERTLSYFERAVLAAVDMHEAAVKFGRGDEVGARLRVSNAARIAADHPRVLADLGTLLAQNGDLDGAERLWRQAVTLDPEFGAALTQLDRLAAVRRRIETEGRDGRP